jgi:hypothetical protein
MTCALCTKRTPRCRCCCTRAITSCIVSRHFKSTSLRAWRWLYAAQPQCGHVSVVTACLLLLMRKKNKPMPLVVVVYDNKVHVMPGASSPQPRCLIVRSKIWYNGRGMVRQYHSGRQCLRQQHCWDPFAVLAASNCAALACAGVMG